MHKALKHIQVLATCLPSFSPAYYLQAKVMRVENSNTFCNLSRLAILQDHKHFCIALQLDWEFCKIFWMKEWQKVTLPTLMTLLPADAVSLFFRPSVCNNNNSDSFPSNAWGKRENFAFCGPYAHCTVIVKINVTASNLLKHTKSWQSRLGCKNA